MITTQAIRLLERLAKLNGRIRIADYMYWNRNDIEVDLKELMAAGKFKNDHAIKEVLALVEAFDKAL